MADPVMIQKQIKDNNEDLLNFVRDLKFWEEDMKRKDHQLSNNNSEEVLPPIRRAKVSKKEVVEKKNEVKKSENLNKRIRSYDYKAWDNFDVEKACEEVEKDKDSEEADDEDDDTEENRLKYNKEKALYEKDVGNRHVAGARWGEAEQAYSRAIRAYPADPVFWANRALCHLKLDKLESVESDCTESLKLDGTYVKALLRRAVARERLGRREDARADLTLALQLEPNNGQARSHLDRLKVSKKNDVKVSVKKPSNDDCGGSTCTERVKEIEPNWEQCNDTVEPISKPPHLRSKKSLKRIEIVDVGRNTAKNTCPRPAEMAAEAEIPVAGSASGSAVRRVPPPPANSVQFHIAWKAIRGDKLMCYRFIKQIAGDSLPALFKESLESSVFGDIVAALCWGEAEGEGERPPLLPYLRGLSRVPRFAAIALFMTATDKTNLQKLFDRCLERGECSREEIENLRRIYEMK